MKDTEKATLPGFESIRQTKECDLVFTFLSQDQPQDQPNRERIRVSRVRGTQRDRALWPGRRVIVGSPYRLGTEQSAQRVSLVTNQHS